MGFQLLKRVMAKKFPVYGFVVFLTAWTFVLMGCHIIPTSYTTTTDQENLTRQNTLLQIELYRRYDTMEKSKLQEFLSKNVEFAIAMEEIITGEVKDTPLLFEKAKQERNEKEKLLEKIKENAETPESGGS